MKNKCIGFKVLNPTSSFPISLTKKKNALAYIAHKKNYLNFTLKKKKKKNFLSIGFW